MHLFVLRACVYAISKPCIRFFNSLPARLCILPVLSGFLFLFYFVLLFFLSFCRFCLVFVFVLSLELCRCSSDLFLSSRPRTVPDWQPRTLLDMVEARSVNAKNYRRHVENGGDLTEGERNVDRKYWFSNCQPR